MKKEANTVQRAKNYSKPAAAKAALNGIHRSAKHLAVLCCDAVLNGEQSLGIFCSNAQHTCHPAPKHGPRPTHSNCGGHTYNIASANGAGQACGQGRKLAHIACRAFVALYAEPDSLKYVALWKAQTYGQIQMRAEEQYNHGHTPQVAIYKCKEVV